MSLILGVIGERSAGKDTLAQYLVDQYGAFAVSHSRILDEILELLDLPISRRNEIDIGEAIRGVYGTGIIAQGLRKKVLAAPEEIKVIQSIRFPEEVTNAKSLGARLIYLEAPLDVRYERAKNRRQKADDNMSFEQFQAMQNEYTEIGIAGLKKDAEFIIENNGTLVDFYKKIDELMNQLGAKPQRHGTT